MGEISWPYRSWGDYWRKEFVIPWHCCLEERFQILFIATLLMAGVILCFVWWMGY